MKVRVSDQRLEWTDDMLSQDRALGVFRDELTSLLSPELNSALTLNED